MKKIAISLILLLNVTNISAYADCITGYACSIKELNQNNTNSVIKDNSEQNNITKDKEKIDNIEQNKIENSKEKINETSIKKPNKSQI